MAKALVRGKVEYPLRFDVPTYEAVRNYAAAHQMSFNRAMHVLVCQSLDAARRKEQRQQRQGKSAAPVITEA